MQGTELIYMNLISDSLAFWNEKHLYINMK